MTHLECLCEGEFTWACGPECDCFHHPWSKGYLTQDEFDQFMAYEDIEAQALVKARAIFAEQRA